jgi:hypothetical protein
MLWAITEVPLVLNKLTVLFQVRLLVGVTVTAPIFKSACCFDDELLGVRIAWVELAIPIAIKDTPTRETANF